MDIIDHLTKINKADDSVQIAIYADLSTHLVLAEATEKEIGQEHLDKLCMQSAAAFDNPLLSLDSPLVEQPNEAIAMLDDGIIVALRTAHDSNQAICLLCDYNIDIDGVLANARNVLSEIGAA